MIIIVEDDAFMAGAMVEVLHRLDSSIIVCPTFIHFLDALSQAQVRDDPEVVVVTDNKLALGKNGDEVIRACRRVKIPVCMASAGTQSSLPKDVRDVSFVTKGSNGWQKQLKETVMRLWAGET